MTRSRRRPLSIVPRSLCLVGLAFVFAVPSTSAQGLRSFHDAGLDLPHPAVSALVHDPRGFLWIGTLDGVLRYDGQKSVLYRSGEESGLTNATVNTGALAIGPDGSLWVGTEAGLCRRFQHGTRFRCRTRDLSNPDVLSVLPTLEGIWVGTRQGLDLLTPSGEVRRWTTSDGLPGTHVTALLRDRSNRLWVGTNQGLAILGASGRPLAVTALGDAYVTALARERRGDVWVATFGQGLFRFDSPTGTPTHLPGIAQAPVGQDFVSALEVDPQGTLWVGTWGDGAYTLAPSGDRLQAAGLADRNVSAFAFAAAAAWVGTWDGLEAWRDTGVEALPLPEAGPALSVLQTQDGTTWVGTARGLYACPSAGACEAFLHRPDAPESLCYDEVSALAPDGTSGIWVGTRGGGLCRLDRRAGTFRRYRSPVGRPALYVHALTPDPSGGVWMGTQGMGVCHASAMSQVITCRRPRSPAAARDISAILPRPDGTLWLGTLGAGIIRYSPSTSSFSRLADLPAPLQRARVLALDVAQGKVWAAAVGGLWSVDVLSGRSTAVSVPLAGVSVTCVAVTAGRLWVGTGGGLVYLGPPPTVYGTASGLPSPALSEGACAATPDGVIVATARGAARVSLPAPRQPQPPQLDELWVDGVRAELDTAASAVQVLRLPHHRSALAAVYTTAAPDQPDPDPIEVRLDGLHEAWTPLDDQRRITFAPLPPGRYTLRARTPGTQAETKFSVVVTPPLWRHPVAFVIWGLLAIGALALAIRIRVHTLLRVEHVRQEIAGDLHDDLGTRLSSIALGLDVASRLPPQALDAALPRHAATVRDVISDLRDTVWVLDGTHDTLPSLIARAASICESLFPDDGFHLDVPARLPEMPLGADTRRHLLFWIKEAAQNAARHADATRVTLRAVIERRHLVVSLIDNGQGFDPQHAHRSVGLESLSRRGRWLHGASTVSSASGQGTTACLRILVRRLAPASRVGALLRRWRAIPRLAGRS